MYYSLESLDQSTQSLRRSSTVHGRCFRVLKVCTHLNFSSTVPVIIDRQSMGLYPRLGKFMHLLTAF